MCNLRAIASPYILHVKLRGWELYGYGTHMTVDGVDVLCNSSHVDGVDLLCNMSGGGCGFAV